MSFSTLCFAYLIDVLRKAEYIFNVNVIRELKWSKNSRVIFFELLCASDLGH